jgi:hypothetical protein
VTQTIATDVGSDYLLSFYLGSLTSIWGGPPVSILATAGSASQTCTDNTTSTVSTWTLCTVPFTALLANTPITLLGSAGFNYIGLDNVSVTLVDGTMTTDTTSTDTTTTGGGVPEPGSIGLLGIGAAGGFRQSETTEEAAGSVSATHAFEGRRSDLRRLALYGPGSFATLCNRFRNRAAERATDLGATDENPTKNRPPAPSGITFPGELL